MGKRLKLDINRWCKEKRVEGLNGGAGKIFFKTNPFQMLNKE